MPSHVDLKGNEEAAALADEVVNSHRVRLKGDIQRRRVAENRLRPLVPPAQEPKRMNQLEPE